MLKPSLAGKLGYPPCCRYETLGKNSDTEHSGHDKNNNRIILCCVVVLGLSVLALCCVGIPLIVYILSAMRVMEARLGSLEKELAVVTSKYELLLLQQQHQQQQQQQKQKQQQPTTLHEASTPKEILKILKRRKRNQTRHTAATTNFIHLIGKGSNDPTTQVGEMRVFKWQKREHRQRVDGFTLLPNNQDTSSIKILNSGVYLVYSQVAVHGRSDNNVRYYCSHNMVLKKAQNGPTSNILSSHLTQDNRGLEYHNMSVNGLKPLDSQLHMGVFFLLPEDELSVRIPSLCDSTNYSTVSENSYFGVVKIG